MFDYSRMLPSQRKKLTDRVQSLSLIRRNEMPARNLEQGFGRSMTHDYGFEIHAYQGQMILPFDLPPAA